MRKLLIILVISSVFFCSSSLADTPLVYDDFEIYSEGSWPSPDWIKGANAQGDPAGNGKNEVVYDPEDSGNKTLNLFGSLGGSWAGHAYHECDFPTDFWLEFDVYNGSEALSGDHPYRATIEMREGTNWSNPNRNLIRFNGNGNIEANDGESWEIIQPYETEQWYNVKIQYSRIDENLTLNYWIDEIHKKSINLTIVDLIREESFDHLNPAAQEGSAYFDNVSVVPEPATVVLLGLGGLGLLGRKRC